MKFLVESLPMEVAPTMPLIPSRPVVSKPRKRYRGHGLMDAYLCWSTAEDVVNRRKQGGSVQTTIDSSFKKENRKASIQNLSKWFYKSGIALNTVKSKDFKVVWELISRLGPGH